MDLWMSFITCVKDNQPCTRRSLKFRGKGKYEKYIDEAFKLGLIKQGEYKNEANEDLITLTQKGEEFFNKKLTIEELKGEKKMKQLTCEMCGSTDLVKQDGYFVCQTCGCKYSVEEAKKMMIEGTVEIQGSVKIDKKEEVKNLLEVARRAYDDDKVEEAEELYKQVLAIDPNNYTAIFFQGMSIGWQASLEDYGKFSQAHKAALRALKLLKEEKEKGEEPWVINIIASKYWTEFLALGTQIATTCIKAYGEAVDEHSRTNSRLMNSGVSDRSWYVEQFAKANARLEKSKEKYDKIHDNTYLLMLEVVEYIYNVDGCICIYDESVATLESLIDLISTMKNNAQYGVTKNSLENYKSTLEEAVVEIKEKAIEKYWLEHAEEKIQLEKDKEELEAIKTKNIDEITKLQEEKNKSPNLQELINKQKEIESLEAQKKALGLFKSKEKKALQEQIDALLLEKEQIKAKVAAEQQEIEEKIIPIREELNKAYDRIKAIEDELTRDRYQEDEDCDEEEYDCEEEEEDDE